MRYARWLDVVSPRLTEPLFAGSAVERLKALARYLPGSCQAILEASLQPAPAVDLSVQVAEAAQALELAEAPLPDHLCRFLVLWATPHGPFAPVSRLWLEFDLRPGSCAFPVPTVCARLSPGADFEWLSGSLWPALRGRALTVAQRELARRALREAPPGAGLLYAFSLLSRPGEAIRLELFGLEPPGPLLEYLGRVAPEHAAAVAPCAHLAAGAERVHLSFDVGEEILPRIGIEGSFPSRPEREPRWRGFLDRLVEHGLGSAARRDAALAWPGTDTFWTAAERWPLSEAGLRTRCVRGLSHAKVVCGPGLEPEAKIYLTLGPVVRPAAGGAASLAARPSALST